MKKWYSRCRVKQFWTLIYAQLPTNPAVQLYPVQSSPVSPDTWHHHHAWLVSTKSWIVWVYLSKTSSLELPYFSCSGCCCCVFRSPAGKESAGDGDNWQGEVTTAQIDTCTVYWKKTEYRYSLYPSTGIRFKLVIFETYNPYTWN